MMVKKYLPAAIITIFLITSCVTAARKPATVPDEIGNGQIIMVGQIVLHPPLAPNEQKIQTLGAESLMNGVIILNSAKLKTYRRPDIDKDYYMSEPWTGRIEAKLGETFYTVCNSEPLYLYAGAVCLKARMESRGGFYITAGNRIPDTTAMASSFIYLPINIKVNIKPGDRAVYIGTFHYYRNEFNQIIKIQYQNNYEQELLKFREKFGNMPLQRPLVTLIKTGGYLSK